MKRISTLGGAVFLIWFCFSPLIALLFSLDINFLLALVLSYIFVGFIGYVFMKVFKQKFFIDAPPPNKILDIGNFNINGNTKFSVSVILSIICIGIIFFAFFGFPVTLAMKIIAISPIASLAISMMVLIAIGFANWHKTFRQKVNYYLSGGQDNEHVAYAQAEELLYLLNALLVSGAGIVAVLSFAYLGF